MYKCLSSIIFKIKKYMYKCILVLWLILFNFFYKNCFQSDWNVFYWLNVYFTGYILYISLVLMKYIWQVTARYISLSVLWELTRLNTVRVPMTSFIFSLLKWRSLTSIVNYTNVGGKGSFARWFEAAMNF